MVVQAYLSGVGWLRPAESFYVYDDTPIVKPGLRVRRSPEAEREIARAFVTEPEKNVKTAMRLVAMKAKTPPHVVWREWAISEFIWNWRVLVQEGLQRREESAEADELLEQIGIEPEEAETYRGSL
jgi:hypothetical protein